MRLIARRAIMGYVSITGSWAWPRYKRFGMPIRYTFEVKVFARSEELDA